MRIMCLAWRFNCDASIGAACLAGGQQTSPPAMNTSFPGAAQVTSTLAASAFITTRDDSPDGSDFQPRLQSLFRSACSRRGRRATHHQCAACEPRRPAKWPNSVGSLRASERHRRALPSSPSNQGPTVRRQGLAATASSPATGSRESQARRARWNTSRMDAILARLKSEGARLEEEWLRRIGPVHFSRINFRGTFRFHLETYAALLVERPTGNAMVKHRD